MPTFDTPEPISLSVELGVGDLRVAAAQRADTVVDVRPSDPAKKGDVTAAEQTRVEYADGRLSIQAPKGWRQWAPFGPGGDSIEVRVDLPAGSNVWARAGVASLDADGPLGECRFRTGVGNVRLERAGAVTLRSGAGDVSIDSATGSVDVTTGSGTVQIGRVDGTAVVKNSNGDTTIGEAVGEARVNAANGRISIGVARDAVTAKSANGAIHLDEVARGAIVAQSALGSVEVGVRDGVAAWLDLETKFGHVRNDLDRSDRPEPGEEAVDIHARTGMGDITIARSVVSGAGKEEA
jgi:hypothetical protein